MLETPGINPFKSILCSLDLRGHRSNELILKMKKMILTKSTP